MKSFAGGAADEGIQMAMKRLAGAKTRSRIGFADGTTLSAQANEFTYCWPRNNTGPWESVEVGMPNREIAELMPLAEDFSDPTGTVYARVPVVLLAWIAAGCGGRVDRQSDWLERTLGGEGFVSGVLDAEIEPKKVVSWSNFESAALAWCQAAILHSPDQERSARFAIEAAPGSIIEWPDIQTCFATAGWSEDRDPIAEWRSKISLRLELEIAAAIPRDELARARRSI